MQVAAVLIKRIRGDARTEGRRGHAAALRAALLASSALVAAALPAAAQDATWLLNATVAGPVAGTFDFNAAANWSPATVPTGTAFFGTSNTTALSFSTDTTIGGWTFNAGAPAYTFTNGRILTFDGAGIIINGGSASITNKRTLRFTNSSSAGSASILNDTTAFLSFFDTSTAGSATITNGDKAAVVFNDNSTAGSASITNNIFSSSVTFNNTSSAGSASITNNGVIIFNNTSSVALARSTFRGS